MSQYIIIAPDGKRFGPADFQTLSQWAQEGRVMPGMMVEDTLSQQTMVASAVPGISFGQPVQYAEYPRAQAADGSGMATAALVVGIIGLVAWCVPIIGFPIGIVAIVLGARSLKSTNRTMAIVGLSLGIFCLLLSTASAILGAVIMNSLQ